jgi:hypothetical protein
VKTLTRILLTTGLLLFCTADLFGAELVVIQEEKREAQFCSWGVYFRKTPALQAVLTDPDLDPNKDCWIFDPSKVEFRVGLGLGMMLGTYEDDFEQRSVRLSGIRTLVMAQLHMDRFVQEIGIRASSLDSLEAQVEYRAIMMEYGLGYKVPFENWDLLFLYTMSGLEDTASLRSDNYVGRGDVTVQALEVSIYRRFDQVIAGGRFTLNQGGTGEDIQSHRTRENGGFTLEIGARFR